MEWDLEVSIRVPNAYETRCASRGSVAARHDITAASSPNCFLALRTKEGSPLCGYVQQNPWRALALAVQDTSQKQHAQVGAKKQHRRGLRLGSGYTFVI